MKAKLDRQITTGLFIVVLGLKGLFAVSSLVATKEQINAFLGGLDAKVVYSENRKQLKFVDLSAAAPVITTLQSVTTLPQAPSISPDGMLVAYSNKSDGMYNGEGYVQTLSATGVPQKLPGASVVMPRWWVNPWTSQLAVTYVDRSRNSDIIPCTEKGIANSIKDPVKFPDCVGKQVGDVKVNPWEDDKSFLYIQNIGAGVAAGVPVQLARGPWEAGISRDGQYTSAGQGTGIYLRNMGTNSRTRVFDTPKNGVTHNLQICNTSISQGAEKTDEVLFVDFGSGGKTSTVVGKAYGIHEVLFVVNAKNEVTNWMPAPEAGLRMDNPDWSSHPRFAITNVRKSNMSTKLFAVYLIDLQTKKFLKILESADSDLWHPALWVKYDGARTPFQATEPVINLTPSGIGKSIQSANRFQMLALPGFFFPAVNIPQGKVVRASVYDAMGRLIFLQPGNSRVAGFQPGAYFLRVSYQSGETYTQKMFNTPR